ncbi:hypothetical protein [Kitasatospora sp. NPDC091207]|uniref:hypothetical protein n=1 Tax=Kitasatospora sp. NPDC091207 TaxID=3364083 RepID=UPI00380804DA
MVGLNRSLLLVLVAVVLLGGAGAVYALRSDATEETPVQAAQARRLTLILAGLIPKSEGSRFDLELAARSEGLIAACMSTKGLQYIPKDPRSLVDTETSTDFSSLVYAQGKGFGIAAWPRFAPSHENDAYTSALTGASLSRYNAILESCAMSSSQLADREFGVRRGNSDYNRIDGKVRSDSRYRVAEKAWSACAKSNGYDHSSRSAFIMELRAEYHTLMQEINSRSGAARVLSQDEMESQAKSDPRYQEFSRKEIDAAVATFSCSQEADRVYREVFSDLAGFSAP